VHDEVPLVHAGVPAVLEHPRDTVSASIHPCQHPCIHVSIHPSMSASTHPCQHPSIHVSIYPSMSASIHPCQHPSIHTSIPFHHPFKIFYHHCVTLFLHQICHTVSTMYFHYYVYVACMTHLANHEPPCHFGVFKTPR
jgi:hypothetical protein